MSKFWWPLSRQTPACAVTKRLLKSDGTVNVCACLPNMEKSVGARSRLRLIKEESKAKSASSYLGMGTQFGGKPQMASPKRYHILGCTLALMAVIAFLSATSRTNPDPLQDPRPKSGNASPEEAFDVACRTLKDYFPMVENSPVLIDSQFRATLLSKPKIWTIKGYAFCPSNVKKSYRWTVILSYDDAQQWEVLAKIVTPELTTAGSSQIEGISQVQGKLFQSDYDR
jgi:hypothetical protein